MGYGIDVSSYQGSINWASVAKAGIQYAILKATTKSNVVESAFEKNYAGCIKNGIKVGAYKYVYAKTVSAAKIEAKAMVKVLADRDMVCGVWIDVEDTSLITLSKANLTKIINAEAKILKDAGYSVGIYCNRNWYYNYLDYTTLKKSYPFWIARYASNDSGNMVASLSPKAYAFMWQYSQNGKVNGVSGGVDRNYSFADLSLMMGQMKTVNYSNLKVRSNTTSSYKVYGKMAKGTEVMIIGTTKGSGFNKIVAKTKDGKLVVGYCLRKYLK